MIRKKKETSENVRHGLNINYYTIKNLFFRNIPIYETFPVLKKNHPNSIALSIDIGKKHNMI